MKTRRESGRTLDAEFEVEDSPGARPGIDIVLLSRARSRPSPNSLNPDYNEALEEILRRLAAADATILNIEVDSTVTRSLPEADRRLDLVFPIELAKSGDLAQLRKRITSAQGTIGRAPGAKSSGGNKTRRIRMTVATNPFLADCRDAQKLLKATREVNVFLLVWNPKRWDDWDGHLGEVAKTAAGQPVPGEWSLSSRRSGVFPGDRLLLLRQGRESGILASGVAVAVGAGPECIYEGGHWDESKPDETAFYTDLEWDRVLLLEDVLPRETLKQQVPEVTWEKVQGSGQIVESPVAKKLLALWYEHLSGIDDPESETWRSPTDDEGWFIEGKRTTKTVNRYERNRKARAECIARHGDSCVVCDFNFGKRYGEHGLGFIEVHHLKPVGGGGGKQRKVNPDRDLRPVCPNCHAMLHKTKDRSKPLPIAQLKRMLSEDL